MADDEGFLRRWSRRKQEARHGREPEPAAAAKAEPDAPGAESPERGTVAGLADDRLRAAVAREQAGPAAIGPVPPVVPPESLPDIASLGAESDFRAFMRPGVPPGLRNQALRRLWRVKPLVRSPERLVEYDDDYTDAARAAKGLRTLYRVGRGVLTDEELAAALDAEQGAPAAPDAPATGADDPPAAPAADCTETAAASEEAPRRPADAPDATG